MIRPLAEDDWTGWKALWDDYLRFYRKELAEETSRVAFDRLAHRDDGMFGLVHASGSVLDGFAHGLVHRSTWSVSCYCYLEDLYVSPSARGTGVAQRLIEAVVEEGRRRQADRIYWHAQEYNAPARSLYDRVGHRTSFVVYESP